VLLIDIHPKTLGASSDGSNSHTYQRKFNTIAHRFLDMESSVNDVGDDEYKLLDEFFDSILTAVPEPLRTSAASDPAAALQVLAIVDGALASHNFVLPPDGSETTMGSAFEPRHLTAAEVNLAQLKSVDEKRQVAMNTNAGGSFYYMDCNTTAVIYLAVAQLLKLPLSLVDVPGHFFLRWSATGRSFNWDPQLARDLTNREYISRAHIPSNLVAQQYYLTSLDNDQVLGIWHGVVGNLYASRGAYDKALQEYRKAVEMYSTSLRAMNNLAWFLSTCPDVKYRNGHEAAQIATRVVHLWPKPTFVDTLAAAYAEEHKWDAAISSEMRAKDLSRSEHHSDFERSWPEFDRFIDAYRQHRTYADLNASDLASTRSVPPPPIPSKEVLDYLTALQRVFKDNSSLSTTDNRDEFCRDWSWLASLADVSTLEKRVLGTADAKSPDDCDKEIQLISSTRQSAYSNPLLDWVKNDVERRVRSEVAELGLPLSSVPTIAALPVGFLNARVLKVPNTNEPLIILNDEVFRFPFGICMTVSQAINFRADDQHKLHVLTDADQIAKNIDAHPEIVRTFEFNILNYLHRAPHVLNEPLSYETDADYVRSRLVLDLAEAIEDFVLAHEYSHVILGHSFYGERSEDFVGPTSGTVSVHQKVYSWRQEFEADAMGFVIMDAILKHDAVERSGDWRADPFYPLYLSAPSFFFMSMGLLEQDESILETGKEPPEPSQEDKMAALQAADGMFGHARGAAENNIQVGTTLPANSHPPFFARFIEAKSFAEKAQSLFFQNSKLSAEQAQVFRLGTVFQDTLLVLSNRAEPLFRERYQSGKDSTKDKF
jgi:tetratricopeptide (TPR) repeat protein